MKLFLKNIKAINFRNYDNLDLNFNKDKHINLIHSPNGMGKSNLLEIIYYLSYFRPFRNALDKELIKKNEKFFSISGNFLKNNITNNIKINYNNKKELIFNNKKPEKYSQIFGKLLSVLFCNEDIFIINGSPSIRRKFFDIFLSTLDEEYLYTLKNYQNILKQKNFILKEKKNYELISIYNKQLSGLIVYLQKKRHNIIELINKLFKENFYNIGMFDNNVKILYSPSIKCKSINKNNIYDCLENNLKKDINYSHSTIGSHRDNYIFLISGIAFSKYASFGQTRLAALVLKLIQTKYYSDHFGFNPILLLDDVILELDKEKQKKFINIISKYDQIFLTVTNREYIKLFNNQENINEIEVFNGKIR